MLRVSVIQNPAELRWVLQGRLAEPWLAELRASWQASRHGRQERKYVVDLTEVTAIDKRGERLLRIMARAGAEFITSGVYTKHVVDGVKSKSKRWLPSCLSLFSIVLLGIGAGSIVRSSVSAQQISAQAAARGKQVIWAQTLEKEVRHVA